MDIGRLKSTALEELKKISDHASLESWRIKFLGRKSELSILSKSLPKLLQEERRNLGKALNETRQRLESEYQKKEKLFGKSATRTQEFLDISQPGRKFASGHLHPLTITLRRMLEIFSSMGFEVVEGQEIETEYYNFDALNIPAWHPARDMWDTFWLKQPENAKRRTKNNKRESLLLRTHTSPLQIRYMEAHQPPFRIVMPGRVFRHEATDARHESQFYQLEGLMVGEDVSLANFKSIMEHFLKEFFGSKTELQLRASYFPFTEPSLEVLMTCPKCGGKGSLKDRRCAVCGGEKWLEIAGAGMVHPQLFRNVGYNPEKVQGFAFGMGVDRFTMIKYKIDDIRLFYSGDLRFIRQF